ncbi:DUF3021 domain-containing protein [Limosilactobacillus caviae]|uniref:DUF3021 domain-containing protein n=1 Tax=Limosilactobacillus caviae TaxID=1769424 RepID=UPI00129BBE02|nr:DUF3021 domain-containing protein [Limosilactobacillus caviae]MCD7124812.1 DUF3021 domain-containing protein [Limosilactobacillus caviae]MRH45546.1 DUF3021 family protein [Limosilactobacillus reuteri]
MKRILKRFLKGLAIGSTTYLVFLTTHFQPMLPTTLNTISVMVISGIIGVATFIFQTDLNYFGALIVHFIITVLLVAVMIVVNHWGITLQSLWLIVIAYVVIWIVLRLQQERDVREINAKLNKRK